MYYRSPSNDPIILMIFSQCLDSHRSTKRWTAKSCSHIWPEQGETQTNRNRTSGRTSA